MELHNKQRDSLPVSFNTLCRACLSSEELLPLFDLTYEDFYISDIFTNCVAVEVKENDALPQNICRTCVGSILGIYNFKLKCELNDNLLQEAVNEKTKTSVKHTDLEWDLVTNDTKNSPNYNQEDCKNCNRVDEKNLKLADLSLLVSKQQNYSSVKTENLQMSGTGDSDQLKMPSDEIVFVDFSANGLPSKMAIGVKEEIDMEGCTLMPPNEKNVVESQDNPITKKPTCSECNESFKTIHALKVHRRDKHPLDSYSCRSCRISFETFDQYKVHRKKEHVYKNPITCELCGKSITTKYNMRKHMVIHAGKRNHICNICGKGFTQSSNLSAHQRTHSGTTPYKCKSCNCSFAHKSGLTQHFRLKHVVINSELDLSQQCRICKRVYSSEQSLKKHMATHENKKFLCNYCGSRFSTRVQLNTHFRVHTGDRPFLCAICCNTFTQPGALASHMLIHTKEKPFICEVCGKGFRHRNHFADHKRIHTGEKPYICPYCGKAFRIHATLHIHKRTHTGETPHTCDVCGKGFYHSSALKKHRGKHVQFAENDISTLKSEDLV